MAASRASRLCQSTAPSFRNNFSLWLFSDSQREENLTEGDMHGLIYLIGLIVVILFILSLFGLR
jgi:hypothetical protein